MSIRVPRTANMFTLREIYWEKIELYNEDIRNIFPKASKSKIAQLKKAVKEKMVEEKVMVYNPLAVKTEVAFKVWGLDIDDIEKRCKKLMRMGANN